MTLYQGAYGVPRNLTPEIHDEIVANVRLVLSIRQAAALSKVNRSTLQTWLRKGEEEVDPIYVNFATDVKKAQAEEATALVQTIRSAPERWQAIAWLLERCFRDDYGAHSEEYERLYKEMEEIKDAIKKMTNPLVQKLKDDEE